MTVETGLGEYLDKAVPLETAERPNHHLPNDFANRDGIRFITESGDLINTGHPSGKPIASVGRPVDVGFDCWAEGEY